MPHTSGQQKYSVRRDGHLDYNRRVPVHAQSSYGKIIRIRQGGEASAELLTQRLDAIWKQEDTGTAVNLLSLLGATNTRPRKLSEIAEEYVELKGIQENPTISSVRMLAELSGDIAVDAYIRQDARNFVASLISQGNRTTSIRRRLNCLTAVFNYAYSEYDYSGQNPFSQVRIPKEGTDATRRIPFDVGELAELYNSAMTSGKRLRMAVPILGETGCRIAEVIGLRISDIAEDYHSIRIVAHPARRVKTPCSTRTLPLVGQARVAMRLLVEHSASDYLFPEYFRDGTILATHAGNTLNKWMKPHFGGKTAHCLRHAFRDRLRAVECPLELLDALGGWSSLGGSGSRYGNGYDLPQKATWLEKIAIDAPQPTM